MYLYVLLLILDLFLFTVLWFSYLHYYKGVLCLVLCIYVGLLMSTGLGRSLFFSFDVFYWFYYYGNFLFVLQMGFFIYFMWYGVI